MPGAKLSGTDQPPIVSRLTGTAAAPIQLRQNPGERAIIDGGMRVEGAYTWYIDFEVTNSNPDRTLPRPTGMNVYGHHVKLINLIIHDCGDGIGFWQPAEDSEVYGAILYRNGWEGPSDFRGNGHGIYIQNRNGQKRIIDLVSFDNYATGMKAYTEQGFIIGIRFEGNISFNNGSSAMDRVSNNRLNNILTGAGINAADGIEWISNYTYHPLNSRGPSLQLGYTSENNKTGVMRDNYFVGGNTTLGYISRWENLEVTGNSFIGSGELLVINTPVGKTVANYNWNNNTYFSSNPNPIGYKPGNGDGRNYSLQEWQRTSGVDGGSRMLSAKPTGTRVFVRPNRYAPGRANIAVYNWDQRPTVDVDFSRFLRTGDQYEIRNAQDYFGAPVAAGTFNGRPIQLPMNTGAKTAPEFNAFVLISSSSGPPIAPSTTAPQRRPASNAKPNSTMPPESSAEGPVELSAVAPARTAMMDSLDFEESRLLALINEYRLGAGRNPLSPAISLLQASDWAARDMAARNYRSRNDSLGRSPRERARAFGFPTDRAPVEEESLPAVGECTAQGIFEYWKSDEAMHAILLHPNWKNLGLARALNPQTGLWHWNVTFAAYWDKSLPLAGEDPDGTIEGNGLIRTRPPAESLLANHRFSGYGDNGQAYDPVHCDLDSPAQPCWRDPMPARDARLYETSSAEAIAGHWRIFASPLSAGLSQADLKPPALNASPLEFEINPGGGWTLREEDASGGAVVIESGTWTVTHLAERNEEVITFQRASGQPSAVIRAHAVPGRLTFLAGDAVAIFATLLRDWPTRESSPDNPPFIFVPR